MDLVFHLRPIPTPSHLDLVEGQGPFTSVTQLLATKCSSFQTTTDRSAFVTRWSMTTHWTFCWLTNYIWMTQQEYDFSTAIPLKIANSGCKSTKWLEINQVRDLLKKCFLVAITLFCNHTWHALHAGIRKTVVFYRKIMWSREVIARINDFKCYSSSKVSAEAYMHLPTSLVLCGSQTILHDKPPNLECVITFCAGCLRADIGLIATCLETWFRYVSEVACHQH